VTHALPNPLSWGWSSFTLKACVCVDPRGYVRADVLVSVMSLWAVRDVTHSDLLFIQ
jgi:hypothetical protein